MAGENHVFLGAVVPEERGAPESRSLGDVVDGRLLVSTLVEERECGVCQSLTNHTRGSPTALTKGVQQAPFGRPAVRSEEPTMAPRQ